MQPHGGSNAPLHVDHAVKSTTNRQTEISIDCHIAHDDNNASYVDKHQRNKDLLPPTKLEPSNASRCYPSRTRQGGNANFTADLNHAKSAENDNHTITVSRHVLLAAIAANSNMFCDNYADKFDGFTIAMKREPHVIETACLWHSPLLHDDH